MTHSVLRIDASARHAGSVTRELTDKIISKLSPDSVVTRDLAISPIPQIDEAWVGANFTPVDGRSDEQIERLNLSGKLVDEIKNADTLVIGLPIYNFGVPAALKAWIDHIARAGLSFQYSSEGPKGLLTGKRAIIAVASGGTATGSDIDFATPYIRHVLGFIGITDVDVVAADQMAVDADLSLEKAKNAIATLPLAA